MTLATASERRWTNPSVLQFAGGREPLAVAHEAAAALLSVAHEHGLVGPPVDVIALAAVLGIELQAKDELEDAQIRPRDGARPRASDPDLASRAAGLVIDYNPSRPRGRLRFSIAHELGHLCFPDVSGGVHQRSRAGALEHPGHDEWETELLCNLIASDLLLPDNALDGLVNVGLDLDFLMESRRRWDISTEALLRRFVASVPRPMAVLALSRTEGKPPRMRVDYLETSPSTGSAGPLTSLTHGDRIQATTALRSCVAVGQVTRGVARIGAEELPVQAVAVPPYPGQRFPRVLALVEEAEQPPTSDHISFVVGDLLEVPDGTVPLVFAHVVPDTVRAWSRFGVGAGLARAFPDAAAAFRAWTIANVDNLQLGNAHLVETTRSERRVLIASLVAQEGHGRDQVPRLRYDALAWSLEQAVTAARRLGGELHVPRLGAGAAGGRWDHIERVLLEHTDGVPVVVHTLPAGRRTRSA